MDAKPAHATTGSWIKDILEDVHHDVETPYSYLYWSLISCISAVAANQYTVRTLKGNVIYYPNMYVMLLGESGLGKGYPINLAKRIVQAADTTRVIAGRSSIQAIIKELATTKSVQGKPVITDSRGFIVNGELSTAIIQDPDSLTVLTDLYDRNYNPQWTNLLKGDGAEKLKEPYITCLFGSSPSHFYDSIPQANIEGGYIGRNLVVYEEQRSKELDLLTMEDDENIKEPDKFTEYIVPRYVPHLVEISKRKIRLIPTGKGRDLFNGWRKEWRANQHTYNDRTGFITRVPDHVMKVAMCLCLARYNNGGMINDEDFVEAIEVISALVYDSNRTTAGTGEDPLAPTTKRLVESLMSAPDNKLSRQQLLVMGYGHYGLDVMDKCLDTLLEMGWVRRKKEGIGKNMDWIYLLDGEPLERLQEKKKAKK